MLRKFFSLDAQQIDQIGKAIAHYSVGFVKVSTRNNIEEAVCAGSGTLVTVGSLHGILTAAHVLDALAREESFGLVVDIKEANNFQKQLFSVKNTDTVALRGTTFNKLGPDLGFMRLPLEQIGWLKAQMSFYNLFKIRGDALSNKEPRKSYCDMAIGIIHELTSDIPSERPHVRRQRFSAVFCQMNLVALKYPGDYELFYFEPTYDPNFPLPESFEGMSGGAVWRFYVEEKEGPTSVIDRRLIAVPFFQTVKESGRREIICHGPIGVYGALLEKIIEKWPKETQENA